MVRLVALTMDAATKDATVAATTAMTNGISSGCWVAVVSHAAAIEARVALARSDPAGFPARSSARAQMTTSPTARPMIAKIGKRISRAIASHSMPPTHGDLIKNVSPSARLRNDTTSGGAYLITAGPTEY